MSFAPQRDWTITLATVTIPGMPRLPLSPTLWLRTRFEPAIAVTMLALALLAGACRERAAPVRAPLARASEPDFSATMDAHQVAGIAACEPLDTVSDRFPGAVDTTFHPPGTSPGDDGAAKFVTLPDGGDLIFESVPFDDGRDHVVTVSTTSPSIRSRHGLRVGMTVAQARRLGLTLTLNTDGWTRLELAPDSIVAGLDSASALLVERATAPSPADTTPFTPPVARFRDPIPGLRPNARIFWMSVEFRCDSLPAA